MSAAPAASILAETTDTAEARRLLAARAHVLGCTPAIARELTRLKKAEQDLTEKVAVLEGQVGMLTTLVLGKAKEAT